MKHITTSSVDEVFMKEIYVEPLTTETFRPYGEYVVLPQTGNGECFCPDLLQLPLGQAVPTAGLCRVGNSRRVTMLEYHRFTSEGFLPINGDCVFFAGAPVPGAPFAAQLHAFVAPKGTFVRLNPGVVHGAQFSLSEELVDILLVLPSFTFGNDTDYVMLEGDEQIKIVNHFGRDLHSLPI